jgi:hypothetical protein
MAQALVLREVRDSVVRTGDVALVMSHSPGVLLVTHPKTCTSAKSARRPIARRTENEYRQAVRSRASPRKAVGREDEREEFHGRVLRLGRYALGGIVRIRSNNRASAGRPSRA